MLNCAGEEIFTYALLFLTVLLKKVTISYRTVSRLVTLFINVLYFPKNCNKKMLPCSSILSHRNSVCWGRPQVTPSATQTVRRAKYTWISQGGYRTGRKWRKYREGAETATSAAHCSVHTSASPLFPSFIYKTRLSPSGKRRKVRLDSWTRDKFCRLFPNSRKIFQIYWMLNKIM